MRPSKTSGMALSGVKVVAFEVSVSAPHCSRLLGDMGAEVIKIERPGKGDLIRHWDSVVRGESAGFVWLNYNKRSFAVDVKTSAGREAVKRLVAQADVFLENFAPGVAAKLGFSYEELSAANPRLVYCSVSGYGQDGPYRDVKAYDLLIQGEAGMIMTTGYPDRPAKVGIPICDLAASMYASTGILLALYQREKTGRGQQIDISMFESILSWEGYFPHFYWHAGEEPERVGMRHHYVTPYGPYLAGDGVYVNFAVATPDDWKVFCLQVIEHPDLFSDPRFTTTELRRKNRVVMEETIEKIFLEKDHNEWLQRLKVSRLPYGEVRTMGQVLTHPQVVARKMVQEVDSPVGSVPVIASPLHLSDNPSRLDPIPSLGQDTEAILKELGYSSEEIRKMKEEHAI